MAMRQRPPQGSTKAYRHFVGITLVGAGLVALASLTSQPGGAIQKRVERNRQTVPRPLASPSTAAHAFDMPGDEPGAFAADNAASAPVGLASLDPITAAPRPSRKAPPSGDPAKLVGVRYASEPSNSPVQPTADQAARLIDQSRRSSGAADRGD